MADWKRGLKKKQLSPKLQVNVIAGGLGKPTNGKANEPVGVVHGQEYVVSQPIVRALGGNQAVEKMLAQELQRRGVKGFQLGGGVSDELNKVPLEYRDKAAEGITRSGQLGTQPTASTVPQGDALQNAQSVMNRELQNVPEEYRGLATEGILRSSGVTAPQTVGSVPGNAYAAPVVRTHNLATGSGTVAAPTTGTIGTVPGQTSTVQNFNVQPSQSTMSAPVQEPITPTPVPGKALGVQEFKIEPPKLTGEGEPLTPETAPPPSAPALGEQAYAGALANLQAIMTGTDPASRRTANALMGYMQASNAAERAAYQQKLAQQGITPSAANAYMALMGRQQRSEEAGLAGELAQQAGARAQTAAGQLGQLGMDGMQFGEGQRQYDETMAFNKQKYGDERSQRIADDVNAGVSLEMINQGLEAQGLPPITQADYDAIKAAGPLGERDYTRNMDMAKTLIQAGGADNLRQASNLLTEQFPGVNIDWTRVLSAENAVDFEDGMSTLAGLVATPGMDWSNAMTVMQTSGALQKMGISMEQAETLFNSMRVNVIDESWNTIQESDWFQNLDADMQDTMQLLFDETISGRANIDVVDEYGVYDAAGNKVRTFTSQEAANDFAADNEGYSVAATGNKRLVFRDEDGSTYDGTPDSIGKVTRADGSTSSEDDVPQGTYYMKDGVFYKSMGKDVAPKLIDAEFIESPDFDPFDVDRDLVNAVMAFGKDNAYYSDVVRRTATIALERPDEIPIDLVSNNPALFQAIAQNVNTSNVLGGKPSATGQWSASDYHYPRGLKDTNGNTVILIQDQPRLPGGLWYVGQRRNDNVAGTPDRSWYPIRNLVTGEEMWLMCDAESGTVVMPEYKPK